MNQEETNFGRREFFLSSVMDIQPIKSLVANQEVGGASVIRIIIDPDSTQKRQILEHLRDAKIRPCVGYLQGEEAKREVLEAGAVLADCFLCLFLIEDSSLTGGGSQISQVLAAHRIPEIWGKIFNGKLIYFRKVQAHRLGFSLEQTFGDGSVLALRESWRLAALQAAELLLEGLEEDLYDLILNLEGFEDESIESAWPLVSARAQLFDSVLRWEADGSAADAAISELPRSLEARLLLSDTIREAEKCGITDLDLRISFKEPSPEEGGEKEIATPRLEYEDVRLRHLKTLSSLAEDAERAVACLARDRDVKFIKKAYKFLLRKSEAPTARKSLLKICSFLRYIAKQEDFRVAFLSSLVAYAKRNPPASADSRLNSVQEQLWPAIGGLRDQKVILALPQSLFPPVSQIEIRDWLESNVGTPCEVLGIGGTDGWLYYERAFEADEFALFSGHGRSEAKAASREILSDPPKDTLTSPSSNQRVHTGDSQVESNESDTSGPEPNPGVSCARQESNAPCTECGASRPHSLIWSAPHSARLFHGVHPPLICQKCGGLNVRAWWLCWNHGKNPIPVPSDKVRCPDCILLHHEDPDHYPLSSIGVNPRLVEPLPCPHCLDLHRYDPAHRLFIVPEPLIPFYKDGVNGHDRIRFQEAVKAAKLIDDCRCPYCGTLLIPVHHRSYAGQIGLPFGHTYVGRADAMGCGVVNHAPRLPTNPGEANEEDVERLR
jgi:hypothetical protein